MCVNVLVQKTVVDKEVPFYIKARCSLGFLSVVNIGLGKERERGKETVEGLTFDVTNEIQEKEKKKWKTFFCQQLTDKVKNCDCTILFVLP